MVMVLSMSFFLMFALLASIAIAKQLSSLFRLAMFGVFRFRNSLLHGKHRIAFGRDDRPPQQATSTPFEGFQVESLQYKNTSITVLDLGGEGQEKLRPKWRQYFKGTTRLIFVVDSTDRHWDW